MKFDIQILPRRRDSQISTISSSVAFRCRLISSSLLYNVLQQGLNLSYTDLPSVPLQSRFAAYVPRVMSPLVPPYVIVFTTERGVATSG